VNESGEERKKSLLSRLTKNLFSEVDRYLETGSFSKPPGRRLSLEGGKLTEEIRKEIEREGEPLKKFLELVDSFKDIIPEEDKQFNAALKALGHAAGLGREDVVGAADRQLAELKKQQDIFSYSVAHRRRELKSMGTKSREIKTQIADLRDRIRRLEEREKGMLSNMEEGEREILSAEESFGSIVDELGREIAGIKKRILHHIPGGTPVEEKTVVEASPPGRKKRASAPPSAPSTAEKPAPALRSPAEKQASGSARQCPVCNNQMDWYEVEKKWKCFVCAHEEQT
jgi:predicted  nucleic acid-binding Zn-ribbon protein